MTHAVAANPAEPHTTATLARIAHLSERQLSLLFRDQLGRSPREVIESFRIEAAQRLLLQGISVPGSRPPCRQRAPRSTQPAERGADGWRARAITDECAAPCTSGRRERARHDLACGP
ncbi:helix-turn-helix domain-containing protein [Streptomyces sp. NPDC060065]|uniref:helix-turn-helix domain-containing protein n=1 Tax=Streptomyces sp. NPDC060065 TaxID=3347050 RepID=UPI0036BF950D